MNAMNYTIAAYVVVAAALFGYAGYVFLALRGGGRK